MLLRFNSGSDSFKERRAEIFRVALLVAAVFCLLVAAFGALLSFEYTNFKKTAVETTAVITKTGYETATGTYAPDDYRNSREVRSAVISVEYDIGGVKHEAVLRGLWGMTIYHGQGDRTGEKIQVLYNPNKPADVRSGKQAVTYNILMVAGIVLFVILLILRKRLKKRRG